MSNGDLQYVSDTLLIERIALIDEVIYKEAGILSDIFTGVVAQVRQFVAENIDKSSTGSIIRSVLKILEPAVLFKAHWMLGVLSMVGMAFGFSVTDMVWKIVQQIKPDILSGQGVSPSKVNQAAQSLVAGASEDLFEDLRKYADNGELTKLAQWGRRVPLGGSIIPTRRNERRALYRMFGFLHPFQRRRLAAAIVAWFIKTILLGAGLLTVGGSAAKMLGPETSQVSQPAQPAQPAPMPGTAPTAPKTPMPSLRPNIIQGPTPIRTIPGLGQPRSGLRYRPNDARNVWYEPLKGTPQQTLLYWTKRTYPQLAGYDHIIRSDPNFQRMVGLLRDGYDPRKPFMAMPMGFTRWVDVVNQFAGDVYRQIPKGVTDVATV